MKAAEACPSLHMSKCHITGNYMLWLINFQSMHWAMPKKDYMLEGDNCEQQTDSSGNTCHSSKSQTDVDSDFINNGNLEEF